MVIEDTYSNNRLYGRYWTDGLPSRNLCRTNAFMPRCMVDSSYLSTLNPSQASSSIMFGFQANKTFSWCPGLYLDSIYECYMFPIYDYWSGVFIFAIICFSMLASMELSNLSWAPGWYDIQRGYINGTTFTSSYWWLH